VSPPSKLARATKVERSLKYFPLFSSPIGVAEVFKNQKKIEGEAKKLQAHTVRFVRQTDKWLDLIEGFNSALKVCYISRRQIALGRLHGLIRTIGLT
jgi:GCN5-like protein 1 (GCN5L1)